MYVNEKLFTTFNHRRDLIDVKVINVRGDVDIADIQYLDPQVRKLYKIKETTTITIS